MGGQLQALDVKGGWKKVLEKLVVAYSMVNQLEFVLCIGLRIVSQRAMNFIASLFAFYCKSAKEEIYINIFISYRLDGFQLDESKMAEKSLFTT